MVIRPEHYCFDGGVAVAQFDRRHSVGRFVNLVVGTASGSTGWKRGYKQTQSVALGHLLGHWPPPKPTRGATWYSLDHFTPVGLECLEMLMAHSRHSNW